MKPSTPAPSSHAGNTMLSGAVVGGLLAWGLIRYTGHTWTGLLGILAGIGLAWYSMWLQYSRQSTQARRSLNSDVTDEEKS